MDSKSSFEVLSVENPLLTTVKGTFHMMRLAPPREFKSFGAISSFYELAEPRLTTESKVRNPHGMGKSSQIIPVRVCGSSGGYSDSLGFILAADLQAAQIAELGSEQLPPSTVGNPIPRLKGDGTLAVKGKHTGG